MRLKIYLDTKGVPCAVVIIIAHSRQISYYERTIKSNPDYEFAGVFADRGYTGTKDDRPEFLKMLKLCREGKIDTILTKSVSRFARNTTVILEYVRELKLLGVEVHFEKENIKTLSKDGELMLAVLSSFGKFHSIMLRKATQLS